MKITPSRCALCSTMLVAVTATSFLVNRTVPEAVIAAALPADQVPAATLAEIRTWFDRAEPVKIAGPIHFVGTRGLGVFLITTSEGHILLYGGMPSSARHIENSIRKLGFKPEDIKILLTSHAHADHVGTHAHFKRLSGAQVALMAEEVELLQSGGKADFHYAKIPLVHFPPVTVDRVLRDGESITLGEITMTAHHTPGHTKGGTTWSMDIVDGGKRYHVVFPDGTGVNPGYRLVRHPSYPGIADDFRRALHRHEKMTPDIWLCSHTSYFDFEGKRARAQDEGVSAWVDPEGYRRFVTERANLFENEIKAELNGPDISGTPWRLVRFRGSSGRTTGLEEPSLCTVHFHTDGQASVRAGSYRAKATWKLGGWNEIVLGPLDGAGGERAAIPLIEDWMSLRRFALSDSGLVLSSDDKAARYEFEPAHEAVTAR